MKQLLLFGIIFYLIYKIMDSKFIYKGGKTKQKDWIDWIEPKAKIVGLQFGIPYQAIVVQTALETGWGSSSLLRKYNNFGGIKAGKNDKAVILSTPEFQNGAMNIIKDGFKVWDSPTSGLKGYVQFFHKNPRYKNALKYPNDPYQFIVEIKKAGYATDPNYISKLHGMLKIYYT